MLSLNETPEAKRDLSNLITYMIEELFNDKAAIDFLSHYHDKMNTLRIFPFGYRSTSFEYRGYDIRLKPFDSYNIFYIIDEDNNQICILRILKDLRDWKPIMSAFIAGRYVAEKKAEYNP